MKGIIVSYRRGRHTQHPNQMLVRVDGVDSKEKAAKLVGKNVVWKSKSATITGKVSAVHGSNGVVRVIFERGMPGQAVTTAVSVE